jgi:membrane protease YdiL (CAAX protease family)
MYDSTWRRTRAPIPSVALYLVLVMAFSVPGWALLAHTGVHPGLAVFALMWCPAAAALLSAWISRRPIGAFGWGWPGLPFMAAGYAIPALYASAAYGVVWALGLGRPDPLHFLAATHRTVWPAIPLFATVAVLGNGLSALGEEIGWRGFLVPVLADRFGLAGTALISGAIWTAWHLPLILLGGHPMGTPASYGIMCFTVLVLAESFLFAWLRLASGSLWPCVLLHAVHNTAVQSIFTPLTADTGHTAWFIGEFGAALPAAAILAAIAVLRWAPLRRGWGKAGTVAPGAFRR